MNALRIEYIDNPDLKAVFGGMAPGEQVEFTVMATMVDATETEAELKIDAIEVEEEEYEPTAEEPTVMVVIGRNGAG